jgi:hypothetical protein
MTRQFSALTLVLVLAGAHANAQSPRNLSALPASAFEHVFRHIRHLQAKDSAAAASGRSSNLRAHYKNLAGLTQQQADSMQSVSFAALAELETLDRQAQTLILKLRAETGPRLLPGQKPPEPPAQLAALQRERNAVLVKYRNSLIQALGQSAFARLERALIASYKVGPKAVAPNPGTGQ